MSIKERFSMESQALYLNYFPHFFFLWTVEAGISTVNGLKIHIVQNT